MTCRVGRDTDSTYATHVRSSFHLPMHGRGILKRYLSVYSFGITQSNQQLFYTVVSHENGQFQVYPDYKEINKYTGVLYPYNYEVFRRRLADNHLEKQALGFIGLLLHGLLLLQGRH